MLRVYRQTAFGLALALGVTAAAAQPPAGRDRMPVLPLTQLAERVISADLDSRSITLTFAEPVPVRELLLRLVGGTSLSVVPDADVTGTFAGELKNVSVRQALDLVLPSLGLDYALDGTFIRVFPRATETRIFQIDYLAAERSLGADLGVTAPAGGIRASTTTGGADLFDEIAAGVRTLVSDRGAFNLDRKAGLIQVTDAADRLERVGAYLEAVHGRVHQQVAIDARVLEVELDDPEAAALDWSRLAPGSNGDAAVPRLLPLGAGSVERFLEELDAQGTVSVIARPRLLAMHNEPALVRSALMPAGGGEAGAPSSDVTLAVTPQIGDGGSIMLSLIPMVVVPAGPGEGGGAPVKREADLLIRLGDGETVAVAGFTHGREVRERRQSGIGGGWFGRSTIVMRKRVELVILLTPTIVAAGRR